MGKIPYYFVGLILPIYSAVAAPIDPREYVDWNSPEYTAFVKMCTSDGTFCTGQFVSPSIVLTNAHCAVVCNSAACHITTSNGAVYPVKYIDGKEYVFRIFDDDTDTSLDFAFFKVTDAQFKSDSYFTMDNQYYTGDVFNAGFGTLRILSDDEIQQIRKTYVEILRQEDFAEMQKYSPNTSYQDFQRMQAFNNIDATYNARPLSKSYFQKIDDRLAADGITPVFQDKENFKVQKNCKILKSDAINLRHTCRTAPGNSGGGLVAPSGNLVGIVNSSKDLLGEYGMTGNGLANPVYYDTYQKLVADENN